jgi:uridine kinase
MPPYIIGLTGGSGAGKTTFLSRLLEQFNPEQVCLISQDHYYKPLAEIALDGQGIHNFDTPEAIDSEAYAADVRRIREGDRVQKLEYTFNNPAVVPQLLDFACAPIVLLEGIFVFHFPEIAALCDLKLYIEAQEATKVRRRIKRDAVERGYDLQDVLYRYEHHVTPTYERYVLPTRAGADMVIMNNARGFEIGLEVLVAFLKGKIKE